jgi:hypothetical protein
MRALSDVLDQILEVAPDLEIHFKPLKESIMYTAPEMMYLRWHAAMEILNDEATDHPKADQIAKIFGGEE